MLLLRPIIRQTMIMKRTASIGTALFVFSLPLAPQTASGISVFSELTIDLIEISTIPGFRPYEYHPDRNFILLVEERRTVHLSDGMTTQFGAGTSSGSSAPFVSVSQDGESLQFKFGPTDPFYERFSFGSWPTSVSTFFRLKLDEPPVLIAEEGSFDAVLSGRLRVDGSGPTNDDSVLLGADVGDLIPFSVTYTRTDGPWTASSFDSEFSYTFDAVIMIPEPSIPALSVLFGILTLTRRRR